MKIWFNPSCSKCRIAKSTLDEAGLEYQEHRYLDTPPSAEELKSVLQKLQMEPWDIARLKESAARETGLDSLPQTAEYRERWIETMVQNPVIIQRPILVTSSGKAWVGRSAEAVASAIEAEKKS